MISSRNLGLLLSLLAAPFAVACGGTSAEDISEDAVRDVFTSTYTSTKPEACTNFTADEELESTTQECPGIGAYRLVIGDLDGRANVQIVSEKGNTLIDLPRLLGANVAARAIGPNVEWRVPVSKQTSPIAMYFRVIDTTPQGKTQHNLIVVKLSGETPCVTAVVEATKSSGTANQTARDAEDASLVAACLAPPNPIVEGTSVYTTTGGATCKQTSVGEEHATTECPGLGGYRLEIMDRPSLAQGITTLLKGEARTELGLEGLFDGVRSDSQHLGPNAEWHSPKEGKGEPYALSLRNIYTADATGKEQHHLVIVKLNDKAPCVFSTVEASRNTATANVTARSEMDRARVTACPTTPFAL